MAEKRNLEDNNPVPNECLKDDGYDCLREVFSAAVEQAAGGKGKERHAKNGEAFNEQTIMQTARAHGVAYLTGQAEKKGRESHTLFKIRGKAAAKAELLGAMNYLAAAYMWIDEQEDPKETNSDSE